MAGRWQDDHQEQWRPRDDEPFFYGRERERRSWEQDRPETYAARRSGPGRDPVFGEQETGASYGPANGRPRATPRISPQDYTQGGRYYGDDSRERVYREEYGLGGREYGDVPRGYDADRNYGRQAYDRGGYGEAGYGSYPGEYRRDMRRPERFEDTGRHAGDFLHRAGERVAAWFGGGGEARAYHDYDREGRDRGARGLGPQGYKRSDERISDEVHDRLTDDPWLDASHIAVSVSEGEVTLSGAVESREAKHRAERIVEDIAGVTYVQNNLRPAKGGFFTSPTTGYGDSVAEAQMRKDDPVAGGTGGVGGGQSTAGRKN